MALDPTPLPTPFTALEAEIAAPVTVDPRQTTTRVVRRGRGGGEAGGFLAWPAASSLTFLLSAACLLGGAWTVFASLGIDQDMLAERFGMVGAVHGYELALVLVALVLCRFQRANPDAIGPVILGACFLVGSAVTLDLVSIDAPWLTLACGAGGLLLAAGKGGVLARLGGGPSPLLAILPLAALMAWNLLWPAAMGLYLLFTKSGLASASWWIPGWALVLIASTAVVAGIIRDDAVGIDRARPFLRRSALRWTLALVVAACSGIHLEVLGYLHSLDVTLGEFLPLIAVLSLGAVDLRHRAYGPAPRLDRVLLALPVGLALTAVVQDANGVLSNPHLPGTVFAPALVLAVHAAVVFRLGRHRGQAWRTVSALAAFAAVLTWQAEPGLEGLNWCAAGIALALAAGAYALVARRPAALAVALVLATSLGLLNPGALAWQQVHRIPPVVPLVVLNAMLVLATVAVWPRAFTPAVARVALLALTLGILATYGRSGTALYAPAWAALLLLAMHGLLVWRTRDAVAATPLLIPLLLIAPSLVPEHKGWLAVWAAFALLGAGVSLSWVRVRATRAGTRTRPGLDLRRAGAVPPSV